MYFFVGLHQPADAERVGRRCMISVKRLWKRRDPFEVEEWMMDSGAFSEISKHRDYRHTPAEYAREIARWADLGTLLAAVTQDYMCEAEILELCGRTVEQHQQMTIDRYDALRSELAQLGRGYLLLPTLQGFELDDYLRHLEQYGDRLAAGAWVGLGSVCKRNREPGQVAAIAQAVKLARPDLSLHGFGVKTTALADPLCQATLFSADSMAWSYAARKQGRNANDWNEAAEFADRFYDGSIEPAL